MTQSDLASPHWNKIVFQTGWLEQLDRLAARRFGKGGLAEEASTYVIEQLSHENWSVLSSFKGQCKPESYLYTLTGNYLEEFARKRFGRPRPPEWLKRNGEVWVQIWKWICLEREAYESVVDKLSGNALREPRFVKEAIFTIKAKIPSCGESNKEVLMSKMNKNDDDISSIEENIPDFATPDTEITADKHREILLMLSQMLQFDNDGRQDPNIEDHVVQEFSDKFSLLAQRVTLSDEEKLVLRMAFQDGLKYKAIADAMKIPEHQPSRIIKRTLDRIKTAFDELEIELDEIREIAA